MTQQEFFNRYKYSIRTDKIGGGSFGTVYKVYDSILDKEIAIKVSEVKIVGDKIFSLKDEFDAIKDLPPHRNIANYEELYTYESPQGIFDYALMQLYPHGNLSAQIAKGMSEAQKENTALSILQGIVHLHQYKVVHRDLKPSNILIVKRGDDIIPKITDFGLSKKVNFNAQSRFSNSFGGGTLEYSSPEQLDGKILRLNTDLWAFGVIVYEIFTAKRLFNINTDTTNSAKKEREIYDLIIQSDFTHKLKELPEKWQKIVEPCLIREPTKRIKSAVDLVNLLQGNNASNSIKSFSTSSHSNLNKTITEPLDSYHNIDKNPKTNTDEVTESETFIEEKPKPNKPAPTPNIKKEKPKAKKKNKVLLPMLLGFVAIIIAMGVYFSLPSESSDWRKAQNQNTISSYKSYLSEYPYGEYSNDAQENIDWLNAKERNTVGAYQSYIQKYENGLFSEEAKGILEYNDYSKCIKQNDADAYRIFLNNYNNGKYSKEIENKLNAMIADSTNMAKNNKKDHDAWKEAQTENTKTAYENYIKNNALGQYISEAKASIIKIDKKGNRPQIKWVSIPAGTFTMGSPASEVDRSNNETQHQVKLSAFKMSKYEVTFEQYDAFCKATGRSKPSDEGWGRGQRPVINVSWEDATAFAQWMGCRLPTEAEWEYACRAGTKTPFNTGNNISTSQANYNGNYPYNGNAKGQYRKQTLPVGSFSPNVWGLYDMHGNVWEWCSDRYSDYSLSAQTNPKGPSSGGGRVARGGSWDNNARYCRSADRGGISPDLGRSFLGFRLVSSQ